MGAVARVPVASRTTPEVQVFLGNVAVCERSNTSSVEALTHAAYFVQAVRHGGASCLRAYRINKALPCGCAGGSDM
jgi:hypothetical protein